MPQVYPQCDESLKIFNSPLLGNIELLQGYNGNFSHQGENQFGIDLASPIGTPIYAAKKGRVLNTRYDSTEGGPNKDFVLSSNFVILEHEDGTMSEYYHLNPSKPYVQMGDVLDENKIIGEVGCTGFCAQPHLHFMVYREGKIGQALCLMLRKN